MATQDPATLQKSASRRFADLLAMPLIPYASSDYPDQISHWWQEIEKEWRLEKRGHRASDEDLILLSCLPKTAHPEADFLLWKLHQPHVPDPFRMRFLPSYDGHPQSLTEYHRTLTRMWKDKRHHELLDLPLLEKRWRLSIRTEEMGLRGRVFDAHDYVLMRLFDLIRPQCRKAYEVHSLLKESLEEHRWSVERITARIRRARTNVTRYTTSPEAYVERARKQIDALERTMCIQAALELPARLRHP